MKKQIAIAFLCAMSLIVFACCRSESLTSTTDHPATPVVTIAAAVEKCPCGKLITEQCADCKEHAGQPETCSTDKCPPVDAKAAAPAEVKTAAVPKAKVQSAEIQYCTT